ncbi:unnamed protein product [Amoebophrya sp. A25]|nr:unnamed protein product [Amoebophrya sp. A25]|eukprot:GSA25T00002569001.1
MRATVAARAGGSAVIDMLLDDPIGSIHDLTAHQAAPPAPLAGGKIRFGGASDCQAWNNRGGLPAVGGTRARPMTAGGHAASASTLYNNNNYDQTGAPGHPFLFEGGAGNERQKTRPASSSPVKKRPGTAGTRYQTPLRAGPTTGAGMLYAKCRGHPKKVRPTPFNNFIVFVVDVEDAERMQQAKTVQEMSEDILDALGLKLPHGKELQAIYAGYDGPERISIRSDGELAEYYSRFAGSEGAGETGYDARRDPQMQDILKELEKMRLGGILTKMQMTKYLRILGDNRMLYLKTEKELKSANHQLDALRAGMPAQIERSVKRAVDKREAELRKEFEEDKAAMLKRARDETEKMIKPLKDTAEKAQAAMHKLQEECQAYRTKMSEAETKIETMTVTIRSAEERQAKMSEELKIATQQVKEDAATKATLEQRLKDALEVIDSNGLERPASSSVSGSSAEEGGSSKNRIVWNIPKIQHKLSWPRERSICSTEKQLGSISSVVVEFYPSGVEASYPGYCALRLHVPDRTRVDWGVLFGKGRNAHDCGKRADDFAKHLWWCRNGILWPNLCRIEDLKRNVDRESDSVQLTFEAFSASQLPEAPAAPASKIKDRPRTAGGNFGSRGALLMEQGEIKNEQKRPQKVYEKGLVSIYYDATLLKNHWLQELVAGWLTQRPQAFVK